MVDMEDITETMTIEEIHNVWKIRDQQIVDNVNNSYIGTTNYVKFEIMQKRFDLMQGVLSMLFQKLS